MVDEDLSSQAAQMGNWPETLAVVHGNLTF